MTVVTDWYSGQTVLVTGGTGFMGKVLLEKLLRCCSGVRRIYVMARPRRGKAPSTRLEEITKLPIFENLVKSNPEVLKKLVAVDSDFTQPGLGLNKEWRQQLISEVTIVFNMAASLRLEAGMKTAVCHNTTGTKQVLDFCLEMKQLKAFIHLSTAFCHCDYDILEEKIYPPPHNPHDVMQAMEWLDEKSIEIITPRLKEVPVYNITSGNIIHLPWGELIKTGLKIVQENPYENSIWYPSDNISSSWLLHYIYVIFFHYLPAYFIDFLLLLARQKRFMVRLQNRISLGLEVLQYFTTREWHFQNENILRLEESLSEEDRKIFYITNVDLDISKYMLKFILGARMYCIKEPLSSLPRSRRIIYILYCLHCIIQLAFYALLVWMLLQYVDTARVLLYHSAHALNRLPVTKALVQFDVDDVKTSDF